VSSQDKPSLPSSSPENSRVLRAALSRFATGVTIVTSRDAAGAAIGLTCNSFNSLSLSPPLVTWALSATSSKLAAFAAAGQFAVNVLSAQQSSLALAFAQRGEEKFEGVPLLKAATGLPLLAGALAWFECHTLATHAYGDHVLFVGEVAHFSDSGHAQDPLLFMNGKLG
jgi:flavin reductase (DIM6/NTAB) family NADH-FMN oxidoreductase RutF